MLRSGQMGSDFNLKFLLLELSLENYDLINKLKASIYGWCFLVEYYSGDFRFYNSPLFCKEAEIKPHKEMSFEITMASQVSSVKKYYEYTPNVSTTPVYRFDTTLITWDTDIYTLDYEL
jgi:hypothetical protein